MTVEYLINYNNFASIARQLPRAVSAIARETAAAMVVDITDGMTGPHSGRVYGDHIASAPGEMPAVDLSNLLGSLAIEGAPDKTLATVYVTPEYGAYLETGAPNAGIEPRPFMAPAAERAIPEFNRKMSHLEERLTSGNVHR